MDPHQAAYWLSKPPAEAAEFLAKTAVASRQVGGFVKRAEGPGWQDMLNQVGSNPALKNSLIGAGIGGLGGLGVGLMGKRKKSPWATALTGAALGGAGGLAYTGLNSYMNDPGSGAAPAAEKAMDVTDAQNVRNANPLSNALGKATRESAKANGVTPDPSTAELDKIRPDQMLSQGVRDMPVVGGFFTNPLRNIGVAGATGVLDYNARAGLGQLGNWRRNFDALNQGWDKVKSVAPGGRPAPPAPAVGLGALNDSVRDRVLNPTGASRFVPQVVRETLAGRQLGRMAAGSQPIPGVPAPGGGASTMTPGLTGSHVNTALREGTSALGAPKPPGAIRRFAGGALPSLGLQLGAQYLFGKHDMDQGADRYTRDLLGRRQ